MESALVLAALMVGAVRPCGPCGAGDGASGRGAYGGEAKRSSGEPSALTRSAPKL